MARRELCSACGGNGVVKIPGGISICNRCDGDCYKSVESSGASQAGAAAPGVERLIDIPEQTIDTAPPQYDNSHADAWAAGWNACLSAAHTREAALRAENERQNR